MRFEIVAVDSLGVRSMATFVRTKDVNVFIDPSAALGPSRYGLEPHDLEHLALELARKRIKELLKETDVVIFTHYHWDHYDPNADLNGKVILAKDWDANINASQRKRAALLKYPREKADGRTFTFGNTEIVFSPALPHGPEGTKLGYVVAVKIGDVLFSSDIQGPVSERAAEWIIEQDPRIIIMDGPPTYFLGYKFSVKSRDAAVENMGCILSETSVKEIIMDHHITRDLNYKERFPVYEKAEEFGVKIWTAAEHLDKEPLFLEAWRKALWKGDKEIDANIIRRVYHV